MDGENLMHDTHAEAPARSLAFASARIDAFDWSRIEAELEAEGYATLGGLLPEKECDDLSRLYPDEERFRNRIVMERHGYGRGEYRYFGYPLPPLVAALRSCLYARLQPLANRWNSALGIDTAFPASLAEFLDRCHAAGQQRPTPLLLRYGAGDFNRLHQDLYGAHCFPLQLTILLSRPLQDFTGGEFVMTEQRARMQSRPIVVPLGKGDAVVFAVNRRPVVTARGTSRVTMRHGVATVRSGHRMTAGLIFHDAK